MNDRLREARKALNLTQKEFGRRLGVQDTAISKLESSERNLTEQMIIAIFREYSVNEDWLRTGNGEMFAITNDAFVNSLKEKGYDDMTCRFTSSYLNLQQADRNIINGFLSSLTADTTQADIAEEITAAPVEDDSQVIRINGLTEEEEHELVRRRHADAKKGLHSSTISGKVNHA